MLDQVRSRLTAICLFFLLSLGASIATQADEGLVLEENILLKDGDIKITEEDLTRYVESKVPKSERQRILSSSDSMLSMLQNIYMTRTLAAEARLKGVVFNGAQLSWEYEFSKDSELVAGLQQLVIEEAQKDKNWNAWAREVYLAESEFYMTEKVVDASHILIATKEKGEPEARVLAYEVYRKLQAGASFKDMSNEYSDDKAAKIKGGDLGPFVHKAMVKPFSNIAFSMTEIGGISKPVKTKFGYHIIKLNKIVPSVLKTYDEVEAKIIRKLKARVAAKTREQLLIDTRSKQGIDVNKELVEKIRNKYIVKINK